MIKQQTTLQTPIKIWYKALPQHSKIRWPILDLELRCKDLSVPQPLLALVDSGASMSILHPAVAEILGFDRKKLGDPKPGGISVSGTYKSWMLPELIDVIIYGYTFRVRFTVIVNPDFIWPCILGEDSIFEVAKIDFQKFKGFFEIRFRVDIN